MPTVTYVEHSGQRHEVEVPVGESVMRGALDNSVPGVDGDCGGVQACATCRVDIDEAWIDKVGRRVPDGVEDDMLAYASDLTANSRLSCQVLVDASLDGLIVHLPDSQH